jgi:predicted ATP-binding protein involved in virulence
MSENTEAVYIKEVLINDFKCFKGKNIFSFVYEEENWCQWTVFLGNNNTGKTNLLKAIASLEPFEKIVMDEEPYETYFPLGYEEAFYFEDNLFTLGLNVVSLFKHAKSFELEYTSASASDRIGSDRNLSIYGYGVTRNIESKGIKTEGKKLNAENLFFNSNLINFEDWLIQLNYSANNPSSEKNNREKATKRRELLKEVIKSEIFPEINDIHFITDEKLNNYIEYQTKNGRHKLSELGFGYQATLSWMCDFCKKMFERYPDNENPLKEPAVLLIDELDLHLHPQWQREIVGYLSNIFPKTQFIVTTHSPFILQSMDSVNLYTLQREGDHTLVEHHGSNRSFVGWRIEEILSEIMGLKENIQTKTYQDLIKEFDEALDKEDYSKGKAAFDELKKILHPQSAERKLLDIQFSQLVFDDKA